MKLFRPLWAGAALAVLGGCVVAPLPYDEAPTPRVIYVDPVYPSPGPGWYWRQRPGHGWDWHHRHRWHHPRR